MQSIAMINQKGGVGKTVCAVNIAACIERDFRKRVLIVDCDSQCNATTYLLTFSSIEPEIGIEEYINGDYSLKDVIVPVFEEFGRHIISTKMYVLPGSQSMDSMEFNDDEAFIRLLDEAESMGFDYVMFDCPANLTTPTIMCLSAVENVVVPVSGDINSLSGYGMLVDTVNSIKATTNIRLKILGMFFNNMRLYQSLDKFIYDDNKNSLGGSLFKRMIRASALVGQAEMVGKPLAYYRPASDVYDDYKRLTREILSRIKKGQ
ncbi:MAG: ParA family protein [Lachnospiraceae bacterium]|nr:ParA family protein [Lachnospiraceae bacterium]